MRLVASVVAVSMALSSVPAFASSESDAKDLFTRGRDLRKNGDCPGAITLFSKAYQLYPQGLGSLRNLAECEEQIGKFA
ncbi:MAG: tetratricopeptide repeat protein, partial [Polyangiales bacterium]